MSTHQFTNKFAATQSTSEELKLVVKGFTQSERQMLDAIIKLSQRREPRINLLTGLDEDEADIVMIDATDANAMFWVGNNPWFKHKVVIWADAPADRGGFAVRRPIPWVSLPMLLVRALEQVPVKGGDVSGGRSSGNSVLVVDDSVAVRGQLRSLLEQRGLIVAEVESAEAAIKVTADATYACILMDVLMHGMDGYEACRRIKANTSGGNKANIVMLTGRTSPFDRIKGKMAGCDAYLTKPVDPDKLYAVISRFVAMPADNGMMPQRMTSLQFTK
jgi:twitching motility two-component system response regulator PilG